MPPGGGDGHAANRSHQHHLRGCLRKCFLFFHLLPPRPETTAPPTRGETKASLRETRAPTRRALRRQKLFLSPPFYLDTVTAGAIITRCLEKCLLSFILPFKTEAAITTAKYCRTKKRRRFVFLFNLPTSPRKKQSYLYTAHRTFPTKKKRFFSSSSPTRHPKAKAFILPPRRVAKQKNVQVLSPFFVFISRPINYSHATHA